MLIFLSVLGIFLSGILLYFNARSYASSIYLGLFFLLISLYNFIQYVILESKSVLLVSIVYLNIGFLSYLIGPMLYWYVRSVLTDDSRLKKSDFWHLLPMLIFFIATLPHLFSSWSHKVEIATKIVGDIYFLGNYKSTFLTEIFNSYAIYLSRPLLVLTYTAWSVVLLVRALKGRTEFEMIHHRHLIIKWLTLLFAFLTIWFVGHTLQIIELNMSGTINVFYSLNILQFLSAAGLIGLLAMPFFFPTILYGLPRFQESALIPVARGKVKLPDTGKEESLTVLEARVENRYEADYLLVMERRIESCMMELKPYLQADCNMVYLSKLVDIPLHHLAYYFREEKRQPFNDYRNEWRIVHAKELIMEGKANELTLEAIGLLSGFSTRNTFFTAFKKAEGISPGVFAAQFAK